MGQPLVLPSGEVHLWTASLSEPVGNLSAHLSHDEVARRDRYAFPHLRQRFARGRGLLRVVLGRYLDLPASDIAFDYGEREKPYLRAAPLHFNLSHSEDRWLLAVCLDRRLGVDIEAVRHLTDFESMAKRFFAVGERRALAEMPPAARLEAFYRGWTRKEAYMKATGQGMALALDAFEVNLEPGGARLVSHNGDPTAPSRWTLADVAAPDGFAAALAVEGSGWIQLPVRELSGDQA